jgi:hypothetical protein
MFCSSNKKKISQRNEVLYQGELCVCKNPSKHILSVQASAPYAHGAGFMCWESWQTQHYNPRVGDADLN